MFSRKINSSFKLLLNKFKKDLHSAIQLYMLPVPTP